MTSKVVLTLAAGAVATLLAACGGGGGGGGNGSTTPAPAASLQVSGTAATGMALANAAIEVKCAAGSATTTAAANGTYTVTITGGALPCAIEAKTSTRSLHALVDTGTADASGVTKVRANITPVTELIVAQAGARQPADSFAAFAAGSITPAQIQAAAAAIVAALKDAGVDLGGIDPVKGDLVAGVAAGQGDAYDRLLDALAAKVDIDALKVLVNQVAVAAQGQSTEGLKNAMAAVSGGSLPGCSVAVSGPYRSVDMFGNVTVRSFDFTNMRMGTVGTSDALTITADPSNACVFTASGTLDGASTTMKVVIGANGAGTFRSQNAPTSAGVIGTLFPAQSHAYADLRGTWSHVATDLVAKEQVLGQITYGADNTVTSCAYDNSWTCVPQSAVSTAKETSDGGVSIPVDTLETITVYGYRAPNGAFAVYGGSNPASGASQTSVTMVASKLAPLAIPAVGTVTTSWSSDVSIDGSTQTVTGTGPSPISYSITSADANGLVTRQNVATGRVETLHYNQPVAGLRTRDAGTSAGSSFAGIYQMALTGMGVTLSVNSAPFGTNNAMIYDIAVIK